MFEENTGGFRPKAPLFFGIKQGSQSYLSQIIEDNPNTDINVRDGSDRTVLDYAVINEYPDVLCKLLSRPDIKVNAQNNAGQTSLHLAVSNDYLVGVETLLKHTDLNINAKDKQGRTPLHYAAEAGALAGERYNAAPDARDLGSQNFSFFLSCGERTIHRGDRVFRCFAKAASYV